MKQIINGKLYNTETASYIGSNRSDCYRSDFHYFEEELYRKKTKEFFLYGEGGPASVYAEQLSTGGCIEGAKIVPLTEEEAREWVERNLDADEYIQIFEECEE